MGVHRTSTTPSNTPFFRPKVQGRLKCSGTPQILRAGRPEVGTVRKGEEPWPEEEDVVEEEEEDTSLTGEILPVDIWGYIRQR
jgi:hypothetical protein